MPNWLLGLIFVLSLSLVIYGWRQILRLTFGLEKQRFGWSDDEARLKFFSLRSPRGPGRRKRMQKYLREELRAYAEETGQGDIHRRARLALAAGYAGAIASSFAWILSTAFASQ
ncbi:hypothetical protein NTH_03031 [Nitratireductor thuwali]|uniref:Uncharacterized protein n=2 Tax=Nitratireductor thuwali TaxID=2267699 RepID=A0ABY5MKN3_9HYPH|nr:hypothetical protein NTH_03031 [Nitratireductor thuwali]